MHTDSYKCKSPWHTWETNRYSVCNSVFLSLCQILLSLLTHGQITTSPMNFLIGVREHKASPYSLEWANHTTDCSTQGTAGSPEPLCPASHSQVGERQKGLCGTQPLPPPQSISQHSFGLQSSSQAAPGAHAIPCCILLRADCKVMLSPTISPTDLDGTNHDLRWAWFIPFIKISCN